MKKHFFISILICAGAFYQLSAQNETDALRYSQVYYSGTARATAMGGSFGALGGDFSSLSINPAGIGIYQKNEVSFTPSIYFTVMKSTFNNSATDDRKYNFNLGNFGAVFVMKPKKESSCKGIQFGIGFNRLNNYNYSSYIEGGNPKSSYVDYLMADAQKTTPENLRPFDTKLAFNTYLIDTLGSLTDYISNVRGGGTLVQKSTDVSGSNNELVITIGGNWNDRLYIGGTFGFPYLRYYETSVYEETDKGDSIPSFKHMSYDYFLETHGSGFNFKLGFIYRVADWMRVGAAIHTPTFFSMRDKWHSEMNSQFDTISFTAKSPEGNFDYKLNTPFKANASISFIIGKVALITGEYEMVDYKGARMKAVDDPFSKENRAIENTLAFQSNVRAGFEIKIKQFALRAGYSFSSNPYASKVYGGNRQAINGGVGVKFDRYFLDASYSYIMSKEKYYLYPTVAFPVDNNLTAHSALVTFGVKF
jgi:long-subunit fatty acid transport protein